MYIDKRFVEKLNKDIQSGIDIPVTHIGNRCPRSDKYRVPK